MLDGSGSCSGGRRALKRPEDIPVRFKGAKRRTKPQLENKEFFFKILSLYFSRRLIGSAERGSFRSRQVLIGKYRSAWQHCDLRW